MGGDLLLYSSCGIWSLRIAALQILIPGDLERKIGQTTLETYEHRWSRGNQAGNLRTSLVARGKVLLHPFYPCLPKCCNTLCLVFFDLRSIGFFRCFVTGPVAPIRQSVVRNVSGRYHCRNSHEDAGRCMP